MPEIDIIDGKIKNQVHCLGKTYDQGEYMENARKLDDLTRDAADFLAQETKLYGFEIPTLRASFALSMNSIIEAAPCTLTQEERAELLGIKQTIYNRFVNLHSRESDAARSANLS